MEISSFTGWVEHIFPQTDYGVEFSVRDFKDDNDVNKPKYPTWLKFKLSKAAILQFDDVVIGDKIMVNFYITGRSGNNEKGYWCFNTLAVAKKDGIKVLERCGAREKEAEQEEDFSIEESDIPF